MFIITQSYLRGKLVSLLWSDSTALTLLLQTQLKYLVPDNDRYIITQLVHFVEVRLTAQNLVPVPEISQYFSCTQVFSVSMCFLTTLLAFITVLLSLLTHQQLCNISIKFSYTYFSSSMKGIHIDLSELCNNKHKWILEIAYLQ